MANSPTPEIKPSPEETRRQFLRSFEAKSLRSRSFLTQIADDLTTICGSTPFLIFHIIFFASWIAINLGLVVTLVKPFDPYPFGFLTLVVSLEAIFLSIFILVTQNRSSYINTIRDEVHLGVNLIAEEEITKILEILVDIKTEMGIKKPDTKLDRMLERINTGSIEKSITGQMERAATPLFKKVITPIAHPKSMIMKNGLLKKQVKNTEASEDDF